MAVADARFVLAKALTASAPAEKAEPALKPNHPNHKRPVPKITNGMLAGASSRCRRFPRNSAPARAAHPADMCTTVPPAKSSTPHWRNKPSGCHVMWHNGGYTTNAKSTMNKMYARKRTRPAMLPVMSAGVMMANLS